MVEEVDRALRMMEIIDPEDERQINSSRRRPHYISTWLSSPPFISASFSYEYRMIISFFGLTPSGKGRANTIAFAKNDSFR